MRHELQTQGFRYRLRPVARTDAAFIVDLRTDPELNAFLHPTSPDVGAQEAWLDAYFERPGDYYFIIEDLQSGEPVGTIGLYDSDGRTAEWGRWLVRKGSPAAVESALLIYRVAFDLLRLESAYCRTVTANEKTVSFHDSSGAARGGVLKDHFELGGLTHDAIEHRVDREGWAAMHPRLERLALRLVGA